MSDPTPIEAPRYEPVPADRHRRMAVPNGNSGPAAQSTPERWFEPSADPRLMTWEMAARPEGSGIGRGLLGVLMVTAIVGAMIGAGSVYAALKASGALDASAATLAPGTNSNANSNGAVAVESDQSTIIAAVARIAPSVVGLSTTFESGPTAIGTGIVYDQRGWILTNRHVVEGGSATTVRLPDGREAKASVYGLDTLADLAIIKIDGVSGLVVAPIGSSASIQVGQLGIAIGDPLGLDYPDSVTTGIVSAVGRDLAVSAGDGSNSISLHNLIQTDAAINSGNSGGPIVDGSGRVVGIATAQAQIAQGIGFAVPIDLAKPIMAQALAGEKLARPFIGVSYDEIDRGLQERFKLPLDHGAWVHAEDSGGNAVEAVQAGSPGDHAGIRTGDIITSVEGQTIDARHLLQDVLVQFSPGRVVSLQVYRDNGYVTLMVALGTRPASTS